MVAKQPRYIRAFTAGQKLAEITFMHDVAKSMTSLVKNFFAVRDEKQLQLLSDCLQRRL